MINSSDKNHTSSLEDRHFLSDPRPVPGLDLPTWEVDVHREGVEQPILTLRVDSKVLPPRKKKKKTLWKLPDSIETNPKFGEQDKRRVLELFREKKKELKKLKNKQRAYRRASSMEAMNSSNGGGVDSGGGNDSKVKPVDAASPPPKNLPSENGRTNNPTAKVNNDDRDDSSLSPPGFAKLSVSESGNEATQLAYSLPNSGMHSSSPLKPAPPGLPSKIQQQPNGQQSSNQQNGSPSSTTSLSQSLPPPGLEPNPQHSTQHLQKSPLSPLPPPGLIDGHLSPKHDTALLPRAIGPSFVLPPEAPPGASMGDFVTETYYLLLRNGLIRDLDSYYFKSSESGSELGGVDFVYKAVTVGGAQAVCATPKDRLHQLHTFAGCEMRIKGVQQQSTVGKGILVLITGVSVRNTAPPQGLNGHSHQQQQHLPFCHTLILKPVLTTTAAINGADPTTSAATTQTIGYQILNDNLVILTGDDQ